MENPTVSKYTTSFGLSLALCSVFNAVIVVAKETSPAVQAGLQRATGHHWITHVVIVLILFVVFGWALAQGNSGRGRTMAVPRLIKTITAGVVTAGVIIAGFYLVAD